MTTYVHLQGINEESGTIKDILVEKEAFEFDGGCPDDFFVDPSSMEIRKVQEIEFVCDNEHSLPETFKSD